MVLKSIIIIIITSSFIKESKSKELMIKSHRNACHYLLPVLINEQSAEAVEDFKNLGTFFDGAWSFTDDTEYIF